MGTKYLYRYYHKYQLRVVIRDFHDWGDTRWWRKGPWGLVLEQPGHLSLGRFRSLGHLLSIPHLQPGMKYTTLACRYNT